MRNTPWMRHAGAWTAAALLALGLAGCGGSDDPSLRVSTRQGVVEGLEASSHHQYLGLPYAAAPVGALRWAAPA